MGVGYADDLALLVNTPDKAVFLLHYQKQTARGIGLYVNSDKTEFIFFKQDRGISILNAKSRKLVDQFTYLGSNISSIKTM